MDTYQVETAKPFAESLIWQLNRNYYQNSGIDAWRSGDVPHHVTSNSKVGNTYAELIFAFLKDLGIQGHTQETVHLIELGAGHGRLAYHILQHLDRLCTQSKLALPPYCYIISDIGKDNLSFFLNHPQFKSFFEKGQADVAYFDAIGSDEIKLQYANHTIKAQELQQPIIGIANYFFDSIPTDLFHIKNNTISSCLLSLESTIDTSQMDDAKLLENINVIYHNEAISSPIYEHEIMNEIINEYANLESETYLFFPRNGIKCIDNVRQLSQKGLMLISMDKGYHELHDLENSKKPEMITHGAMSFWVNYHALGIYCKKNKGTVLFPSLSTFNLAIGCLLFLEDGAQYTETHSAYQRFIDDFGPDDFNSIKKTVYNNISRLNLMELISMLRLSAYDSTFFINLLPRLKQVSTKISFNERARFAQTMHETWRLYFTLNESYDLAFEIGGMMYALGYYKEALEYFEHSIALFGQKADIYYNKALCYYHLREDDLFLATVAEGKAAFPEYKNYTHLDSLDLNA